MASQTLLAANGCVFSALSDHGSAVSILLMVSFGLQLLSLCVHREECTPNFDVCCLSFSTSRVWMGWGVGGSVVGSPMLLFVLSLCVRSLFSRS